MRTMGTCERLTCGLMLSCVALDSPRNFSDPQFHHCKNGEDTKMVVKINEVLYIKYLEVGPIVIVQKMEVVSLSQTIQA